MREIQPLNRFLMLLTEMLSSAAGSDEVRLRRQARGGTHETEHVPDESAGEKGKRR